MKTYELIELLKKADPDLTGEVCVNNLDILDVESRPSYYDGTLERVIIDQTSPYFKVIGAKYVGDDWKINISTISIHEAILNNPDIPIEYEDLCASKRLELIKADEARREMVKKIISKHRDKSE